MSATTTCSKQNVTFITFDSFLKPIFNKERQVHRAFNEPVPTFTAFRRAYIEMHGLKPWLERIRGLSASDKQLYSILNWLTGASAKCQKYSVG